MIHRSLILVSIGVATLGGLTRADEAPLPGTGWPAARYESLWTKSPFSVASPEAAQQSTSYSLWGIAQIDGVSYASLTDKSNSEHFLLSSEKPDRGLTLMSIKRGSDGGETSAVIQKDGQLLTLKLDQAPPSQPIVNMAPQNSGPQNGQLGPQISNPNTDNRFNSLPGSTPPPVVRRQHIIHIPPNPQQPNASNQPPPAPQ